MNILNHLHAWRESIFWNYIHIHTVCYQGCPQQFLPSPSPFSHLLVPSYKVTLRCLPDRRRPYYPHSWIWATLWKEKTVCPCRGWVWEGYTMSPWLSWVVCSWTQPPGSGNVQVHGADIELLHLRAGTGPRWRLAVIDRQRSDHRSSMIILVPTSVTPQPAQIHTWGPNHCNGRQATPSGSS